MDIDLLTDEDIEMIDEYHKQCSKTAGMKMTLKNDPKNC